MKMNNLNYILLFIVCIGYGCNNKKQTDKDSIQSLIDSVATKMIQKPLIHSTSIGIVYRGKEFIGHYGELEKGKANTPTNETIYEIGSVSKTLTGLLVANAVLEKKLNLEDEVQKYLPENYPNLKFHNQPILIKHLLSHTSGLPNMLPLTMNDILKDFTNQDTPNKLNEIIKNYGREEFLKDLHEMKIDTTPGYKYSYSSVGVELAGLILEKIYDTEFEILLKDYFSKNVGMQTTKINLSNEELKNLAVGYHCDYTEITSSMANFPWGSSGNIKTTVPDMNKYIKFQLKNNQDVAESRKTIFKLDDEFSLGYFWQIIANDKKLGTFYSHHGGVPRSQCFIYIIPKYDLGVFIITNQSGTNTIGVMKEALNEIFEKIIPET